MEFPFIRRYNEAYYFTLQDLIKKLNLTSTPLACETFKNVLTALSIAWTADSDVENLWQLVYSRFYDHYTIELETTDLTNDDITRFFIKFINIVNMTKDRYKKILSAYGTLSASVLMGKITTTSNGKARFNDTPQESGTFDDDEHTTNITENDVTTSSDRDTPIERIEDVIRKYRNVLKEWSEEFNPLFIEEGNIN